MIQLTIQNRDGFKRHLQAEKDQATKVRLIALNLIVTQDIGVTEVSQLTGTPKRTLYDWINRWNTLGYEGLIDKPPSPGKPPSLKDDDLSVLKTCLKEQDNWTTKEVRLLIKEKFHVELSYDQVRRILKDKLHMHFAKPYALDYRKPDDAVQLLEKDIDTVIKQLKDKGINPQEVAIGFIDESSPQTTANTQRVWSFQKPKIRKNTTKMKANTIGFYAIKGESVSDFLKSSKAEDIIHFLPQIKDKNQNFKAIIAILDNLPSHKSKLLKDTAQECGINLVFLPKYSPDLNPIEFIWKSIKRVLSITFIENVQQLKNIIKKLFHKFAKRLSFAKEWINKFGHIVEFVQ